MEVVMSCVAKSAFLVNNYFEIWVLRIQQLCQLAASSPHTPKTDHDNTRLGKPPIPWRAFWLVMKERAMSPKQIPRAMPPRASPPRAIFLPDLEDPKPHVKQSPHCEDHSMHPDPTKETSSVLVNDSREKLCEQAQSMSWGCFPDRKVPEHKQQDGGPEFPPQALPHPRPLFCTLNTTSQDLLQPIFPTAQWAATPQDSTSLFCL